MSIEANTFERITIENANEKTKAVAEAFGAYLMNTWGIVSLDMNVDGERYQSEDGTIAGNEELQEVCKKLGSAKNTVISVRSQNAGGLNWRQESCFLPLLTDDEDIKNHVTYKSTDYYDTDETVDLFSYGKNGPEKPEYEQSEEAVADIREWYCYTYVVRFENDDDFEDEVRDAILDRLCRFAVDYCDSDEDSVIDDGCEIYLEGSIRFKTESIPTMADLLQQSVDALKDLPDVSCEIVICAVPDGADDYDFASVSITLNDGQIRTGYCRF